MSRRINHYLLVDGVSSHDLVMVEFERAGEIIRRRQVENGVRTEKLLPSLNSFLDSWHGELAGLLVVRGAGSFSQTRLVCAVVNALAYARRVKVAKLGPDVNIQAISREWHKINWQRLVIPDYRGPAVA